MDVNIRFSQELLKRARAEANSLYVPIPKRLTAIRQDKDWFFVEGDGMNGQSIAADNAYEAKAKFIFSLIEKAGLP